MPLYEYHCEPCGIDFERIKCYRNSKQERCPECGRWSDKKFSTYVYPTFPIKAVMVNGEEVR